MQNLGIVTVVSNQHRLTFGDGRRSEKSSADEFLLCLPCGTTFAIELSQTSGLCEALVRNPETFLKKNQNFPVTYHSTICRYLVLAVWMLGLGSIASPEYGYGQEVAAPPSVETPFRKTRLGWQDSRRWSRPADIEFERRVELIHPVVVAGLIVLASFAALLWSAEEWDAVRLLQGTDAACRRSRPRPEVRDAV